MKYLKKIFENRTQGLQTVIDEYNRILRKDDVWNNFFKKEYLKSEDQKFLEEIVEFAEKRLEEIKAEFQKDIDFVKDLYLNYLDDCESFSDYSIRRIGREQGMSLGYEYMVELRITFSERTLKNRRHYEPSVRYQITNNEVLDYWKNIYDFFIVLKSYGYLPRIDYYQPNGQQMVIVISKDEN